MDITKLLEITCRISELIKNKALFLAISEVVLLTV